MAKGQQLSLGKLLAEEPIGNRLDFGHIFNLPLDADPDILSDGGYDIIREDFLGSLGALRGCEVLALDTSMRSSGVCATDGSLFVSGTIVPGRPVINDKGEELKEIVYLKGMKKHRLIEKSVGFLIDLLHPKYIIIEGLGFMTKGQAAELAHIQRGALRHCFQYLLTAPKAKVAEIAPNRLKLLSTGKGNATKTEMEKAAWDLYEADFIPAGWVPKRKNEKPPKRDDEVDAFLMAQVALSYNKGLFDKSAINFTRRL